LATLTASHSPLSGTVRYTRPGMIFRLILNLLRKLIAPLPGQTQVDAGVIVAGYKGDPALHKRPKWVIDGSFMAFRKLEQLVPEFTQYVARNGPRWEEFVPKVVANPPLTAQEGTSLWGARLFGRFRSVGGNMSTVTL
jgi:hypothetical protein